MRVIDFFCGAGGFSEGFRQMGYKVVYGYDKLETSSKKRLITILKLNCESKNIIDFKSSIAEIEKIPDTEIIIGSPPCVSFSSSNKSGGAG